MFPSAFPALRSRAPRLSTSEPGAPSLLVALGVLSAFTAAGCDGAARGDGSGDDRTAVGRSVEELPADSLQVVARGLDTPWEIRFLPNGDLLVTERPGRLLRLGPPPSAGGDVQAGHLPFEVLERHAIPDVRETGEAGLMGLALHPDYPDPAWIYLCHTAATDRGLENRLVRYRYHEDELSERTVLLDGIPAAPIHDGCRLEFGPDGFLYLSMGDAGNADRAQDRSSLSGKILRLTEEGEAAPENPMQDRIWSSGHRNPQGLAFDPEDRLWSTEHGPSGFPGGRDEVNHVRAGFNYGWPAIVGDEDREGMLAPVLHSGSDTWAPAGLAWTDGRLFFGGLRGEALFEVRAERVPERGADGDGAPEVGDVGEVLQSAEEGGRAVRLRLVPHFEDELGRIRAVRTGADGRLYFGTSNRDGRGNPREADDRIFRIQPGALTGG